jgi:predicted phosphohydrolase
MIQITSDLHIECFDHTPDPLLFVTPSADIIILAGDIGSIYKIKQLTEFLIKMCKHFKHVIYVPGNHEYYYIHGHEPKTLDKLHLILCDIRIDNLTILSNSSLMLNDNVCIAGCTLWSELTINLPKFIVNIKDITDGLYRKMYKNDVKFIDDTINKCSNDGIRLIMVTHYCPTYKVLEGSSRKEKWHSLYASDLNNMLYKNKVETWICGHVHTNFDFYTKGGTRIVGNQKGKDKDNIQDYEKNKVILI